MRRILVQVVALLLVSTPGVDAQAENGFYVEFDAGLSLVSDYYDDFLASPPITASFDNAVSFGGVLGYRFLSHYRGEINISHRQTDVDTVSGVEGFGDLDVTMFMANIYYDFDLGASLDPYLGIGVGSGSSDVLFSTDPMDPFPQGTTGSTLAWNLMVGASYGIHEDVFLNFGYRYMGVAEFLADDLDFHEFLIGVRYHF